MVTGRPDEREPAGAGRLDRAAGREQRRLVARLRRRRVAVEPGWPVDAADPGDVLGGMAALDLLDGRRLCLRERADRLEQNGKAPRRLGVVLGGVQLRQRRRG